MYYDDDGKVISSSIEPETPSDETLEQLRNCCALYMEALTKPVLDYVE